MQSDHSVFHRDTVDERFLVIKEVRVWDPELVGHPVVQGQIERDLRVGQSLVSPGLLEVHSQRVVLETHKKGAKEGRDEAKSHRGKEGKESTLPPKSNHFRQLCGKTQRHSVVTPNQASILDEIHLKQNGTAAQARKLRVQHKGELLLLNIVLRN